jgi:hypothetical protein
MSIEARIPHSREVSLIRLPLHRVARELLLLIFQREQVLEDVHQGDLSGQAALAIERPVPKFGIACAGPGGAFHRSRRMPDGLTLVLAGLP